MAFLIQQASLLLEHNLTKWSTVQCKTGLCSTYFWLL